MLIHERYLWLAFSEDYCARNINILKSNPKRARTLFSSFFCFCFSPLSLF